MAFTVKHLGIKFLLRFFKVLAKNCRDQTLHNPFLSVVCKPGVLYFNSHVVFITVQKNVIFTLQTFHQRVINVFFII